jgi:hypothetical protein
MATIINTLEVVLDQPVASPAAPPPPGKPAPPLAPGDIQDVIERQARNAVRLAAH